MKWVFRVLGFLSILVFIAVIVIGEMSYRLTTEGQIIKYASIGVAVICFAIGEIFSLRSRVKELEGEVAELKFKHKE